MTLWRVSRLSCESFLFLLFLLNESCGGCYWWGLYTSHLRVPHSLTHLVFRPFLGLILTLALALGP
jgi:hypothetical protein